MRRAPPLGSKLRRQRTRGFSLVEVMIAIGIFSLIAGLLFASLWSGQTQLARLQRASGDDEQMLALRRVLGSWFEAATVAGTSLEDASGVFQGGPERMVFFATPTDRSRAGGLYRVELWIEKGGEGSAEVSRLRVRRQPVSVVAGSGGGAAAVDVSELLVTQRTLTFAYASEVGSGEGGFGQRWADVWDETEHLPTRIQILDGATPLLTAAVAIGKDARCVLKRGPDMLAGGECLVR